MKIFDESGLRFNFSDSANATRADELNYHGLSAVDFIVETSDEYLFIEVKNPDSAQSRQYPQRNDFLLDPKEFSLKMSAKFKDSLLKELAMGNKFPKPIVYILFLEHRQFDIAQKRLLFERINNHIPKFAEESFSSVHKISFMLSDKSHFESAYDVFSVVSL
ncbi:MAG: hypothetical protein LBD23_07060 [Oscillospiraceae bacterium]|jgi:hypothetical protein|nr:hypothetical protein [Oscillospiraceae bacterium]